MREFVLTVNGKDVEVTLLSREGSALSFQIHGKEYAVTVAGARPKLESKSYSDASIALPQPMRSAATSLNELLAPMPGIIVSLAVKIGDTVNAGQAIVVMEAMKMENNLAAPRTGTIKTIHVKVGQEVENRQRLITIE